MYLFLEEMVLEEVLLLKASWEWCKSEGSILFNNKEILGRPIHEIANLGIGYVSENRDIFPDLTVQENLELGKKKINMVLNGI